MGETVLSEAGRGHPRNARAGVLAVALYLVFVAAIWLAAPEFTSTLSPVLPVVPVPVVYVFVMSVLLVRSLYLARLRPREPWTRAEAVDVAWRVRRNGLADGTATLVLPDGRRFGAQLVRAPLDLFANVAREKALWVAGNQVVGFPHYPVVATARLAPVHA